jgi:protein-disulfide isomerase
MFQQRLGWGAALVLGLLLLAPVAAQNDATIEQDIEALKKGQQQIQNQLEEIKKMLQARPAAAPAAPAPPAVNVKDVVFDIGDNAVRGSETAKVTIIEFSDYQCGYCAKYARETLPQIATEYIDTGKVRYVQLDMPLENMHKLAFKAAEASHCAGEQGKFWEMSHQLFENQRTLEPWGVHATAIGIDAAKFETCLSSGKYTAAVRADMAQAAAAGITGTPGFVVALTDPKNPRKVKGVTVLKGAHPFASFKPAIDQALTGG